MYLSTFKIKRGNVSLSLQLQHVQKILIFWNNRQNMLGNKCYPRAIWHCR